MSADPAGSTVGGGYIRARAGGEVDARRVFRFVIALGVAVLASLVIATTVGAANQNSVQTRLQRQGVPVNVTVTWCEGVSSGIGQALIYYICRGDYVIDGHRYNEVIGGNRAVHPLGQTLRAVTVPGHPALLSTAAAVARKFSPWTPYITPVVLAALTAALALLLVPRSRWRRRVRSRHPAVP